MRVQREGAKPELSGKESRSTPTVEEWFLLSIHVAAFASQFFATRNQIVDINASVVRNWMLFLEVRIV